MEENWQKLTLEQQFEFRRMQDAAKEMSHEQALGLLIQASKLVMMKDNIIRSLLEKCPLQEIRNYD